MKHLLIAIAFIFSAQASSAAVANEIPCNLKGHEAAFGASLETHVKKEIMDLATKGIQVDPTSIAVSIGTSQVLTGGVSTTVSGTFKSVRNTEFYISMTMPSVRFDTAWAGLKTDQEGNVLQGSCIANLDDYYPVRIVNQSSNLSVQDLSLQGVVAYTVE